MRNVFDKFIFINSNFSVSERAESADMNSISPLIELFLLLLFGWGEVLKLLDHTSNISDLFFIGHCV